MSDLKGRRCSSVWLGEVTALALVTLLLLCAAPASGQTTSQSRELKPQRVLVLTIDGLHALDLVNYVDSHPDSALAKLKKAGVMYNNASASKPSDSFPGIMAIITGGSPYSTGIFYEISYDRSLSPPGSKCATIGTELVLDDGIDKNSEVLEDGGGVDPAKLPLDPKKGCAPVFPHSLLRVNTIFEVIKAAGMHTAWTDKQLGYEILQGPSGHGIDDLYDPELHAQHVAGSMPKIEQFDDIRVKSILNEIDGKDHAGTKTAPVPAIFGITFQAVTQGQKSKAGYGYVDSSGTPSDALMDALNHTDQSIGKILDALKARGLSSSTAVIVTAKHGQSPIDIEKKQIVDEKTIPNIIEGVQPGLLAEGIGDTIYMIWLKDQSKTSAVVGALRANQASAHIQRILSGEDVKLLFRDPLRDSRTPDIIVEPELGVIYAKPNNPGIAEHGGFGDEDTHVPILIANPALRAGSVESAVQTAQIAPTILKLLGLDPQKLEAVQIEKTQVLPGLF
jgi:Type I phosphodiesterase / nucleotide pyrophosphatase